MNFLINYNDYKNLQMLIFLCDVPPSCGHENSKGEVEAKQTGGSCEEQRKMRLLKGITSCMEELPARPLERGSLWRSPWRIHQEE